MVSSAGEHVDVPEWPLPEDARMKAALTAGLDTLAEVTGEIEAETDSRKLGGLRRKQEKAKERVTLLELEMALSAEAEVTIWRELWALPQASRWREQGWYRDIAQYARHKARAEAGSLDDAKEARQWSDRLGLSPRSAAALGLSFGSKKPAQRSAPEYKNEPKNVVNMADRRKDIAG